MEQKRLNEDLYASVKNFHSREVLPEPSTSLQHPNLLVQLRPYQMRAVKWMLSREISPVLENVALNLSNAEDREDDLPLNENQDQLIFVSTLPTGGILADEMGLGKTVEVLALILVNPRSELFIPEEDYPDFVGEKKYKAAEVSAPLVKIQGAATNKSVKRKKVDEDEEYLPYADQSGSKKNAASKSKAASKLGEEASHKPSPRNVSLTRKAAEAWYVSKLSEVNTNPIRAFKETMEYVLDVQCICGKFDDDNVIKCEGCSHLLHERCIGATRWLKTKFIYCPQCWMKQEQVKSRATLIVSPSSISGQWLSEVKKHISKNENLKVLVYKGIKVDGFSQPYEFSGYDLILTTYDVLRSELVYANVNEGRSLRYEKKYYPASCPLLCVEFWRICLDEAQMVEGACKAAEMVSRLISIHRWAVTGTPIQKSLQDLYGLVLFLGVEPFCNLDRWNSDLSEPLSKGSPALLHALMSRIMWRSSKKDVWEEIKIPPQSEKIWWLNFSPTEEHFYLRTHQDCANDFLARLSKFESLDWTLDSLKTTTVNYLLVPLLKLRQACSHPQAVRGNVLTAQKGTMTMPELLESLIKKTKVEGQEALRAHIAALNGLAGLHIICQEYASAAEKYRSVLRIAEEYKDRFEVDTLQRLHTLHNLADIVEGHRDVIPPTLRDSQLRDDEVKLENKYLTKVQSSVNIAEDSLTPLSATVSQAEKEFDQCGDDDWWSKLSLWISTVDGDEVLKRVYEALLDTRKTIPAVTSGSVINRVGTHGGIRRELCAWIQNLDLTRQKLLKCLRAIQVADRETLVNCAVDCHLRLSNLKTRTPKKWCQLCECDSLLKKYETCVFDVKNKKQENTLVGEVMLLGQTEQGSWKLSEQERILKVLVTMGKQRKAKKEWLTSGTSFLKLLDALRKEFRNLRLLWTRINERTCARDELNMCKLRQRLRYPDEPMPPRSFKSSVNKRKRPSQQLSSNIDTKTENLHVIELHEVEQRCVTQQSDAAVTLNELRKKSGTMAYLQNLRSKGSGTDSKSNPELCPVCQTPLGDRWTVLSCGHCFCMDCIPELLGKRCAVCRENIIHSDVSCVSLLNSQNTCDEALCSDIQLPSVKGSHSTKVEAVIRRVFYLKAGDPYVKILIFSTWDRVLDVLEEALEQNGIRRVRLKSGPKNQLSLELFKNMNIEDPVTVLLLPLKLGAKGLNLTEATHVMLVEPILNPADELQAIGRVHRIGQTKPTVVHRFLVKKTIEERIFSVFHGSEMDENKITLRQLKDLFTTNSTNSSSGDDMPNENETIFPRDTPTARQSYTESTSSYEPHEASTSGADIELVEDVHAPSTSDVRGSTLIGVILHEGGEGMTQPTDEACL